MVKVLAKRCQDFPLNSTYQCKDLGKNFTKEVIKEACNEQRKEG